MSDNDNESGISGLGWFLAGLGIGALAGVLYAPKAGKETREDLVASALDATTVHAASTTCHAGMCEHPM